MLVLRDCKMSEEAVSRERNARVYRAQPHPFVPRARIGLISSLANIGITAEPAFASLGTIQPYYDEESH